MLFRARALELGQRTEHRSLVLQQLVEENKIIKYKVKDIKD
jgi:hypothetical protein